MHSTSNFYDNLDLKYPEIAIALDKIDRVDPGEIRFIIPILTPNMDIESAKEETVHLDSSKLKNADKSLVEISNLTKKNFIKLKLPKELCAFVGGAYNVLEDEDRDKRHSIVYLRNAKMVTEDAHQSGGGFVAEGGSFDVTGQVSGKMKYDEGEMTGRLKLIPTDEFRYIKAGSRWIVVFVGGDITKPRIIARCPEDDDEPEPNILRRR